MTISIDSGDASAIIRALLPRDRRIRIRIQAIDEIRGEIGGLNRRRREMAREVSCDCRYLLGRSIAVQPFV
jgi:hypothetical protein